MLQVASSLQGAWRHGEMRRETRFINLLLNLFMSYISNEWIRFILSTCWVLISQCHWTLTAVFFYDQLSKQWPYINIHLNILWCQLYTLYFSLFNHLKKLHWIIDLRSSQLGGTCTGITPRYSASAECWVRRAEASQEPGHAASGEYCITITIIRLSRAETGHSDHAPSAVIRAQWHHYHYHYCQVCWKQDCHSLLLLPTYRPSNDLINFMLRKFCTNRV